MKDPYELLGVERSARIEEIKRAYRRKAKQYHPDLNPNDEQAAERFKELSEAYEILSDEQKRQRYDQYGAAAFENGGFGASDFNVGDIFGDIFGDLFGMGRTRRPQGPKRGADMRITLHLSFREAVDGVKKKVQITRQVLCEHCQGTGAEPGTEKHTCPHCHGTGQIHQRVRTPFGEMARTTTCPNCHGTGEIIDQPCTQCHGAGHVRKKVTVTIEVPPGVDTGHMMQLHGEGHAGEKGAPAGDLYVVFDVEPSNLFERRGNDIYYSFPISFVQATLGDTLRIPTLEGEEEVELPAGTQTGTRFTLRGRGVADANSGRRGNLYYTVEIETPTKLTEAQKEALRAYGQAMDEERKEPGRSFFDKLKDLFDPNV